MRRIVAAALAGWGGIMALGWYLADRRAALCSDTYNCLVHETGTRDAFLVAGLLAPFLIAAAVALLVSIRAASPGWPTGHAMGRLLVLDEPGATVHKPRRWPPRLSVGSQRRGWALAFAGFVLGWVSSWAILVWRPASDTIGPAEATEAAEAVDSLYDGEAAAAAASDAAAAAYGSAYDASAVEEGMPAEEAESDATQSGD